MTDDVVIPPRLTGRARDRRGFVVPYSQFIDNNGVPNFRIMDDTKVRKCLVHRWCSMCGQPMGRHLYFIGGPACEKNGYFYDPAMHEECAKYAMQACPHLARSKGRYGDVPDAEDIAGAGTILVGSMDTNKVDTFSLMHATHYSYQRTNEGMWLVKAMLPWIDVSHWRDGERIEER